MFYRDESVRKVAFDKQLFQGSDFKGTSINHVDDQGGRGGSPNIHVNPQGGRGVSSTDPHGFFIGPN